MLKGTIYFTIRQLIFVVTNFILHAYLGRKLGPELYGIFGVISAIIIISDFVLSKGVFETLSKFVAQNEKAANGILKNALKVMTVTYIIVGAILFFLSKQIAIIMKDPELDPYIKLCAFIISIGGISTVFSGVLNGLRQFGKQAVISVFSSVIKLISVLLMVYLGYSVKGAILGIIISEVFGLSLAAILCRIPRSNVHFDGKEMVHFSLQMIVIGLFASLVMNIDLLALKIIIRNNFEIGLYTSATAIARIGLLLMYPVSLTVIPTISKSLSGGDMTHTEHTIIYALKLILMFVLPICLVIMASSKNLIFLLYGEQYVPASYALNILMLGTIFFSIKAVLYNIIVASGWPRYIMSLGVLSLAIDIFLLLFLIDKYGIVGAAAASAITHLFGLVVSYIYIARKYFKRIMPVYFVKVVAASIIVYLIAMLYSPNGILLIIYYGLLLVVFLGILIIMREIKLQNLKLALAKPWKTDRIDRVVDTFPL